MKPDHELRIARETAGLSQVDAAEMIEVSPTHLCSCEKGRKRMNPFRRRQALRIYSEWKRFAVKIR